MFQLKRRRDNWRFDALVKRPSRSISPLRILVVEIGPQFSDGTIFTETISDGTNPTFLRCSLILSAIGFVSSLTTNASMHLSVTVGPKGSFKGIISAFSKTPRLVRNVSNSFNL